MRAATGMSCPRTISTCPDGAWSRLGRIWAETAPLTCLVVMAGLLGTALACPTAAAVTTQRVAAGLNRPVFVTAPPGDTERIFIVEQRGKILIVKNGTLLAVPFLDIQDLVSTGSFFDERGLLGLAFHPSYAENGTFYLNYNGAADSTTIARYQVSGDPDLADPASADIVLKIHQPRTNHNGGTLAFGPSDGYLYIGMGDGGGSGDPDNLAQNDATLLGKILRIDVDSSPLYSVPPDNPFVGPGPPLDEIWAKGLRNPYRWSFDRLTGDMYIADVGQFSWEEIDFQPATSSGAENYGWRLMEGNHCFNPPTDCDPGGLTYPVHEYSHGPGCSVTGGYVYRGAAIPELQGHYFFADWCSAQIWSFKLVAGEVTDFQDRTLELAPGDGLAIRGIAGFGEDALGELYLVDRNTEDQGEVYKIVPDATAVDEERTGLLPELIELAQNYPNPFNPSTTIPFALSVEEEVHLAIYTPDGRHVRTVLKERLAAGTYTTTWDGRDTAGRAMAAGTYLYRLTAGAAQQSRRLVMLK